MRKAIIFFLFVLPLPASEGVKSSIAEKTQALGKAEASMQSQLNYELAIAFFQDQEIDRAFCYFLEALNTHAKASDIKITQEEVEIYERGLKEYLLQAGCDPVKAAERLLKDYGEVASQNPQFLHLNFLVSMAYANLGQYDIFFEKFYRGYPYLHDSFLAYKTKGILNLRLAHHGKKIEERKAFQEEACKQLSRALERNPQDPGLYKVLIFLAKEENNADLILSYLHKLTQNMVELPRSDIFPYVKEAVSLGAFQLGQEIIEQARTHYEYSRALSAAQDYLDQHKSVN